mmetsp:Transcript_15718/g.22363  ORF Transcript_15718/g.22363 Transcript_15718/m.22363 type:complete len:753 (-) Transcript_15718:41-2299(-)
MIITSTIIISSMNLIIIFFKGFVHSAFSFAYESMISKTSVSKSNVPPGALISFIQKGLQYVGIEETLRQDGSDILNRPKEGKGSKSAKSNDGRKVDSHVDFSLLSPHTIRALMRRDPPINLNVPPATAAAAIKAKLELEANSNYAKPYQNGPFSPQPLHTDKLGNNQNPRNKNQGNVSMIQTIPSTNQAGQSFETQETKVSGSAFTNGACAPYGKQAQERLGKGQSANTNSFGIKNSSIIEDKVAVANVLASVADPRIVVANASKKSKPSSKIGKNSSGSDAGNLSSIMLTTGTMQMDLGNLDNKSQNSGSALISSQKLISSTDLASKKSDKQPDNKANTSVSNDSNLISASGSKGFNLQGSHHQNADEALKASQSSKIHDSIEDGDAITRVKPEEVLELNKHTSEVFMCAWNPIFTNLIATGSGDASARIWQMAGPDARSGSGTCRLLQHGTNTTDKNKDVTTLEWSSNGELLATGSYDGVARVWSRNGDLMHTLRSHRGPIFSLKWNKCGNYLLSGSYDKSTIVWDVSGEMGFVKQQFKHHLAPALDVDWKDDSTFASCSTDKTVHICKVGSQEPLHTYSGHIDEVNAVKWDPSGTLLASCSDDCTAKVWDVTSNQAKPLYDFKSHQQEIYTVKWSPTGKGSANPSKLLMLATASFDGSVRLWNVQNGTCISKLSRHKDSVYSVAFSPSGEYLASGSLAGQLYIWNVRDGKHIRSFKGKGDIFEVAWNVEETRVAACFSSNVVNVIDFKL